MKRSRPLVTIIALAVGAGVVVLVAPTMGMKDLPLIDALLGRADATTNRIFWDIRVPRVIMGFLAGAGLAVSGMAFQALFRNPLATPFTLGVSGGAALGAALCIRLGLDFHAAIVSGVIEMSGTAACALSGAAGAVLLVYGFTRLKRGFSTATMLLAGIAMSFFFASLTALILYTSNEHQTHTIFRWTMGSTVVVGFGDLQPALSFVVVGIALVLYLTNELNLMTTGEDIAASRGVDVMRTKKLLFFAASLMVGGIVAACGPIGFVGMMVPQICRLLVGWNHRYLAPATIVFGGAFLVTCDTAARTILAPTEIPVGIITALLGGPFFLWLLLSNVLRDQGLGAK
jgi:iron complex transport system permease protein